MVHCSLTGVPEIDGAKNLSIFIFKNIKLKGNIKREDKEKKRRTATTTKLVASRSLGFLLLLIALTIEVILVFQSH